MVEQIERVYGMIAPNAVAEKDPKYNKKTDEKKKEQVEQERSKMLAIMFMERAHRGFKPMLGDLARDYALGAALYPETVADALQVLNEYTEQPRYKAIMKKK